MLVPALQRLQVADTMVPALTQLVGPQVCSLCSFLWHQLGAHRLRWVEPVEPKVLELGPLHE
jgi:hypothetical protein